MFNLINNVTIVVEKCQKENEEKTMLTAQTCLTAHFCLLIATHSSLSP